MACELQLLGHSTLLSGDIGPPGSSSNTTYLYSGGDPFDLGQNTDHPDSGFRGSLQLLQPELFLNAGSYQLLHHPFRFIILCQPKIVYCTV